MVPSQAIAAALEGQLLDGKYRLKRLLGSGGFGIVMLADHLIGGELLAQVAVKLMPTSPKRLKSQLEELRQSVRLSHPGLVRFHGVGESSLSILDKPASVLYLAMELGGETLLDRMQRGRLGEDEARRLAIDLTEVLIYLREKQVLHRDLKPSNVLLIDGRWKLGDLGIAKSLEDGSTSRGSVIGTLHYMPPEALDNFISPSWDIWSLGVMLMEVVTGQLPYSAESDEEWQDLIETTEPEIPFGLPEALDRVVRSCLARDRTLRPDPKQILDQLIESRAQFPTSGPGIVVVSGRDGQLSALQAAVHAAKPWTRIYVGPGRYEGQIILDKAVEIIGVGAAADIIVDGGDQSALKVTTSEGLVRGLTFHTSASHSDARGVVEVLSGHVTLDLCEITSHSTDCFFAYGRESRPVIRRCRFIGGKAYGLTFLADAAGLFEDCQIIQSPRAGITISDKANPIIRRCSIENPIFRGVFVGENGRGIIEDCSVVGGKAGAVEVSRGSRTIFRRVKIQAGSGAAVVAASGAKAVFVECDPVASNGRAWDLANGHHVQRL